MYGIFMTHTCIISYHDLPRFLRKTDDEVHGPHASLSIHRCPEVFLGLPLTEALDIWSLGCVAAVLFLGALLFEGKNDYDIVSILSVLVHLRWDICSIRILVYLYKD